MEKRVKLLTDLATMIWKYPADVNMAMSKFEQHSRFSSQNWGSISNLW